MSVNVYVIKQSRMRESERTEDVVVGTTAQFVNWIVSQPKYLGSADPDDMRESLEEELNIKKGSMMVGEYEIKIHPNATVLTPTGGRRRRQTRKQKSRRL